MENFTFTIDGLPVEGMPGDTIMRAADRAGIYIPRLCSHPELEPHGSCRICTVLVNGTYQTACTQPVQRNAVVKNETPELFSIRKSLVDMLFIEGNHYCMFCQKSGWCELQAMAYRFGITVPEHPYRYPARGLDATHSEIFIDHDRCILCGRCVYASRDIDGKEVFGFIGRSISKKLAVSSPGGAGSTTLASHDAAMRVCPVGTLMLKSIAYGTPIGKRPFDKRPIGADNQPWWPTPVTS